MKNLISKLAVAYTNDPALVRIVSALSLFIALGTVFLFTQSLLAGFVVVICAASSALILGTMALIVHKFA